MKKLFVTGTPVTGKDLVGRKEEIREIKHLLQNGQGAVLIAPRRFGKTSVALTALQELQKDGYLIADVDLFTITNKRRLAESIVEKTLENKKVLGIIRKIKKSVSEAFKNVEIKQVIENYEFVLKFTESSIDTYEVLESSLDFPQKFAQKEGKPLCFFYDEFGDIAKFDGEDIIKLMRGKFQLHSNVCYLFAGSHESLMKELFAKERSAFYKFCKIIYLGEIAFSDFTPYIRKKFKEEGLFIADNVIKKILERTKGHPYYTQLLCRSIHYLLKGEKTTIENRDIEMGYEDAIASEKPYLEKLWEELKEALAQLEVLLRIASGEKRLYSNKNKVNVARSINALSTKGLIRKTGGRAYSITDPFFEEFLRRNR